MMEWLKLLYGAVGAQYPVMSLILVAAVGAFVSGGAWWLVGREYRKTHTPATVLDVHLEPGRMASAVDAKPRAAPPVERPAPSDLPGALGTMSERTKPPQSVDNRGAVGSTIYQAGRDIVVHPQAASERIHGLVVEARVTCTLKATHGELPPDEVAFTALGDAHAYLDGPAGRQRLLFSSPVRFRRLADGRIVVVNRFTLDPAGDLLNRPASTLKNYTTLQVPIVTVVWGNVFDKMTLLEVSLSINGSDPHYRSWPYDVAFQQGPRFTVDLADIVK